MKFYPRWAVTALFVVALGVSSVANAALVSRLGGTAVYDTDFNITWLADANYAGTTMDWATANSWAAGLTVDGISGWRLPTTVQPDSTCSTQSGGFSYNLNCTGSEMGHLFYTELGGVANYSITATHNTNYNLFQNIQANSYWSGTGSGTGVSWFFHFGFGTQNRNIVVTHMSAWAVHDGDVAPVPLPAAAWLFGSGLLGLISVACRKAA
jgi:hypothetical protein